MALRAISFAEVNNNLRREPQNSREISIPIESDSLPAPGQENSSIEVSQHDDETRTSTNDLPSVNDLTQPAPPYRQTDLPQVTERTENVSDEVAAQTVTREEVDGRTVVIRTSSNTTNNGTNSTTNTRHVSTSSNRRSASDMSCFEFYKNHFLGQLFSYFFVSILFVVVGATMIVFVDSVPLYIGIILIVLGIVPIYLAIQKYRHHRVVLSQRRELAARRAIIRQLHREGQQSNLLYPDLPPSYDNLAFSGDDYTVEVSKEQSSNEDILPKYEDVIPS